MNTVMPKVTYAGRRFGAERLLPFQAPFLILRRMHLLFGGV
jgi:hypothetical protein